jgi:hypothetical protein
MRRNSTSSSMGAFHPVIFFTLVYGISLIMAIFVCRMVYNTINGSESSTGLLNPNSMSYVSKATAYR